MFITTWLLIVIVVIVVSLLLPSIWEALRGIALALFVLLVLISIPASLYLLSQGERRQRTDGQGHISLNIYWHKTLDVMSRVSLKRQQ